MPTLNLNNPIVSVVDHSRGIVTAIQSEVVENNGHTITRSTITESALPEEVQDAPSHSAPTPDRSNVTILESTHQPLPMTQNQEPEPQEAGMVGVSMTPSVLRTRAQNNSTRRRPRILSCYVKPCFEVVQYFSCYQRLGLLQIRISESPTFPLRTEYSER